MTLPTKKPVLMDGHPGFEISAPNDISEDDQQTVAGPNMTPSRSSSQVRRSPPLGNTITSSPLQQACTSVSTCSNYSHSTSPTSDLENTLPFGADDISDSADGDGDGSTPYAPWLPTSYSYYFLTRSRSTNTTTARGVLINPAILASPTTECEPSNTDFSVVTTTNARLSYQGTTNNLAARTSLSQLPVFLLTAPDEHSVLLQRGFEEHDTLIHTADPEWTYCNHQRRPLPDVPSSPVESSFDNGDATSNNIDGGEGRNGSCQSRSASDCDSDARNISDTDDESNADDQSLWCPSLTSSNPFDLGNVESGDFDDYSLDHAHVSPVSHKEPYFDNTKHVYSPVSMFSSSHDNLMDDHQYDGDDEASASSCASNYTHYWSVNHNNLAPLIESDSMNSQILLARRRGALLTAEVLKSYLSAACKIRGIDFMSTQASQEPLLVSEESEIEPPASPLPLLTPITETLPPPLQGIDIDDRCHPDEEEVHAYFVGLYDPSITHADARHLIEGPIDHPPCPRPRISIRLAIVQAVYAAFDDSIAVNPCTISGSKTSKPTLPRPSARRVRWAVDVESSWTSFPSDSIRLSVVLQRPVPSPPAPSHSQPGTIQQEVQSAASSQTKSTTHDSTQCTPETCDTKQYVVMMSGILQLESPCHLPRRVHQVKGDWDGALPQILSSRAIVRRAALAEPSPLRTEVGSEDAEAVDRSAADEPRRVRHHFRRNDSEERRRILRELYPARGDGRRPLV